MEDDLISVGQMLRNKEIAKRDAEYQDLHDEWCATMMDEIPADLKETSE